MLRRLAFGLATLLPACALEGSSEVSDTPAPEDVAQSSAALTNERSFDVDYGGCTEMASLTPVPIGNVRARVPSQYAIVNEANGSAFLVVRISSCASVKVNGVEDGAGVVAQVGVNIMPPDGAGDIDNYALFYDTTSPRLAARLRGYGFDTRWLPGIQYVTTGTSLQITVPGRGYSVQGPVVAPTAPAVPFVADWWAAGRRFEVETATTLEAIRFSTAQLTISAHPSSETRQLLGAESAAFPIFDSYNTFDAAHMTVTRRR